MNSFTEKSCWKQDIEKKEYAAAMVKGSLLYLMIVWIFYDAWYPLLLLPGFLFFYTRQWERGCFRKKEEAFCKQFQDGMKALAAALRAGYSAENALRETEKDLELIYESDSRIRKEFRYMEHQMNMNIPVDIILQEFARRIPQEDVKAFVSVFVVSGKAGGDSIAIVQDTIKVLCGKMEIRQEIKTLITAKQMEFRVMTVVPFGIILYMRLAFSEFMGVLYGNALGVSVMSICLGVYLAAWKLGKLMVEIEV